MTSPLTRRRFMFGLASSAVVLAACQQASPTPQVVEKVVTQLVEKPVEKQVTQIVTQVQTQIVEKQVTQVVEKQVTQVVTQVQTQLVEKQVTVVVPPSVRLDWISTGKRYAGKTVSGMASASDWATNHAK